MLDTLLSAISFYLRAPMALRPRLYMPSKHSQKGCGCALGKASLPMCSEVGFASALLL